MLHEIPQNTDPWANINIRSVNGEIVTKKSSVGTPWSDLWNGAMNTCQSHGMSETLASDLDIDLKRASSDSMPCWPTTVIYGHAASRGLDVKRWSFGTDSGCVRLFSVSLSGHPH